MTEHPSKTEIAHVLFLDIVGYSLESMTGQARMSAELTDCVRQTEAFESVRESGGVLPLPT